MHTTAQGLNTRYIDLPGEGEPVLLEHNDMRWLLPDEVDSLPFCPADESILREISLRYGTKQVF